MRVLSLISLILVIACPPVAAQDPLAPVALRWELFVAPGAQKLAVLWLAPAPGYKTYSHDPGPSGMPTTVDVRLGPSGQELTPLYPPGKPAPDLYEKNITVNVYAGPTPVFVPLPRELPSDFSLQATVSLLACSDVSCWPMRTETVFSGRETASPQPAEIQPWWREFLVLAKPDEPLPPPEPERLPWRFSPRNPEAALEVHNLMRAIPLALLAGLVLNLMPCVLPVATLKLSGLLAFMSSRDARERRRLLRDHNVFYSLGVLAYFALLAAILGAAGLAWGQFFQRPGLILGAAAALLALGLSLFGVVHLPVVDLKFGAREMAAGHDPRSQAFLTGLLSTLLATPCSGPFLGGVLAWTLMQPVLVVVTVFLCIGLGMASPFLLMAARPDLVRFLPRPGPWMEHFEKLAGFLLLGACLYFLTILPQAMLPAALLALLLTGFACHAWGAWTNLSQPPLLRWGVRSLALAVAVAACLWALDPPGPHLDAWKPFDPERFSEALGRENMLVDFTADWCPTCKALEKTVLTRSTLARLKAHHRVTLVRVDITREDPKAMELLRALGSASIPVAALFPAGADAARPVVLRDLFSTEQLENAARQAFGPDRAAKPRTAQATQ
ncbi:hypothetical protein JCM15519_18970 [Fundidesulfovibrio butyratiphilus]